MTLQLVLSPEQRRLLTDGVHKAHLRCVCALCGVCVHCVIVVCVCICGVCTVWCVCVWCVCVCVVCVCALCGVRVCTVVCVCALWCVCVHCVIVVCVCICGVCMHCVLALSKFKYSESVTVNRLSCALPSSDRSNRVTTKTCVYINLNVGMCALCGVGLLCGPPL